MTDTKAWQRNIRIEPELWSYVQSLAPKGKTRNGDCSAVIRAMIRSRMSHTRNRTREPAQ